MTARSKLLELGLALTLGLSALWGCALEEISAQGEKPPIIAPDLPAVEDAEDLAGLNPSDFGCMETEYPTQYSFYSLLPGDELEITVHVLEGEAEGPALYIVGGTHGDELAGWYAGALLEKATVQAGTVYLAAPLNRYGAEHAQRKTKDGWDLNRHFPGDAQGVDAERIAAAVYADIGEKEPALVLDLHEAEPRTDGQDDLGNSVICQDIAPIADLVLALLEDSAGGTLALSAPLNLYGSPPQGSLNAAVTLRLGIPVITVETSRAEPLNLRIFNQLRIAEYVMAWYNVRSYGCFPSEGV